MADEPKRTEDQEEQAFSPDFGTTFDDYGEYREPGTEPPERAPARKRHI